MIRFLANENFPMNSVRRLRTAGHDVAAIIKDAPGAKDEAVLARAVSEHRVILTFDRDYGELLYRRGLPAPAGVLYFRFTPASPEEPAEYLFELLNIDKLSLTGNFTVVERRRVRQRALPKR